MKKLFLLLFVLSLLIVNVNARDIRLKPIEYSVQETQKVAREKFPPHVSMNPPFFVSEPQKIECIDGDTIHVSHIYNYTNYGDEDIWVDYGTYALRIAGIDTYDSKSKRMIEK